jgi:hypothetical protein
MAQQFVWNVLNHSELGIRSLEDIIEIISSQLVALGHTAAWDRTNDKMVTKEVGINILVEGFTQQHVQIIRMMHEAGARFLILATEEPTDKGFNHGTQKEMVARQKVFPLVAPYIEGIIHLVPGEHVTRWYSQFAPSAYTELGYAPNLLRQNVPIMVKNRDGTKRVLAEPDYNFGFYGSLTPRRERLLKRLEKKSGKPVKAMVTFGTGIERDNDMRRAKVILQVRKFDEMGLVSSSRCNTALCIGRPVVAEPHELCKPWDEVVKFSTQCESIVETEEAFFDAAMAASSMWRSIHAIQLAKFKEKFPPEVCIGAALEKIGISSAQRIAPVNTVPKIPLGILARNRKMLNYGIRRAGA